MWQFFVILLFLASCAMLFVGAFILTCFHMKDSTERTVGTILGTVPGVIGAISIQIIVCMADVHLLLLSVPLGLFILFRMIERC